MADTYADYEEIEERREHATKNWEMVRQKALNSKKKMEEVLHAKLDEKEHETVNLDKTETTEQNDDGDPTVQHWEVLRSDVTNLTKKILKNKDDTIQSLIKEIESQHRDHENHTKELVRRLIDQKHTLLIAQEEKEEARKEASYLEERLRAAEKSMHEAPPGNIRSLHRTEEQLQASNHLLEIRLRRMEERYYELRTGYRVVMKRLESKIKLASLCLKEMKTSIVREVKGMNLWITRYKQMTTEKARLVAATDWSISHDSRELSISIEGCVSSVNGLLNTYKQERLPYDDVISIEPINSKAVRKSYRNNENPFFTSCLREGHCKQLTAFRENLAVVDEIAARCSLLESNIISKKGFTQLRLSSVESLTQQHAAVQETKHLLSWFGSNVDVSATTLSSAFSVFRSRLESAGLINTVEYNIINLATDVTRTVASLKSEQMKGVVTKASFAVVRRKLLGTCEVNNCQSNNDQAEPADSLPKTPLEGNLELVPPGFEILSGNSVGGLQKTGAVQKKKKKQSKTVSTQTANANKCHNCLSPLRCLECHQTWRLEMIYPGSVLAQISERQRLVADVESKKVFYMRRKNELLRTMIDILCDTALVSHAANIKFKQQIRTLFGASPKEKETALISNQIKKNSDNEVLLHHGLPEADECESIDAKPSPALNFEGLLSSNGTPTAAARFIMKNPSIVTLLQQQGIRESANAESRVAIQSKPEGLFSQAVLSPGFHTNRGILKPKDWIATVHNQNFLLTSEQKQQPAPVVNAFTGPITFSQILKQAREAAGQLPSFTNSDKVPSPPPPPPQPPPLREVILEQDANLNINSDEQPPAPPCNPEPDSQQEDNDQVDKLENSKLPQICLPTPPVVSSVPSTAQFKVQMSKLRKSLTKRSRPVKQSRRCVDIEKLTPRPPEPVALPAPDATLVWKGYGVGTCHSSASGLNHKLVMASERRQHLHQSTRYPIAL